MKLFFEMLFKYIVATIALATAFAALGFTFGLSIAAIHTAAKFAYNLL